MSSRDLRDRTNLRRPARFGEDDDSDASASFRFSNSQIDIGSSSSSSSISDPTTVESENLQELREELQSAEFQQEFLFRQEEESSTFQVFVPTIDELTERIATLTPYSSRPRVQMTTLSASDFALNPYESNINPAKDDGRKLYIAATKEREADKKLTVNQETSKAFMEMMTHDCAKFAWGEMVTGVWITDGDKTVTPIVRGNTLSMLKDTRKLDIRFVLNQAKMVWNDYTHKPSNPKPSTRADFLKSVIQPWTGGNDQTQFYMRVRSKMIWERLLGSISAATESNLMARKSLFSWYGADGTIEYDGPTALYILISDINPNTRVGVGVLKKKLRDIKMGSYNQKVTDMLHEIQSTYNRIEELGFTHEDIVLDTFNALLSGKNQVFKDFIQRKKDEWESGVDVSLNDLVEYAVNKYNNMVASKGWVQKESAETKLLSLLTEHAKSYKNGGKTGGKKGGGSGSPKGTKLNIEAWRMKKVGDSKVVDGKTYYWCPHHKLNGVFDGLYMTHKPGEGHEEWLARKNKRKEKSKNGKGSSTEKSTSGTKATVSTANGSNKLGLSDKLKAALATKFSISETEAASMVGDICGDLN